MSSFTSNILRISAEIRAEIIRLQMEELARQDEEVKAIRVAKDVV